MGKNKSDRSDMTEDFISMFEGMSSGNLSNEDPVIQTDKGYTVKLNSRNGQVKVMIKVSLGIMKSTSSVYNCRKRVERAATIEHSGISEFPIAVTDKEGNVTYLDGVLIRES